jgi:hypothetical protein
MASKSSPSDHRFYKVRGHATLRHRLKMMGQGKGHGEKSLYKPGIEITSCLLCDWVIGADNKTHRPVEVRITGVGRFAKCRNGHKWRIL